MNLLRMNALLLANRQAVNDFTMSTWRCGTACCLIGNYALRPDLQSSFTLERNVFLSDDGEEDYNLYIGDLQYDGVFIINGIGYNGIWHSIAGHFGLTMEETVDLFSYYGSNRHHTREQAIAYVEQFVAKKLLERPAPEDEDEDEEEVTTA